MSEHTPNDSNRRDLDFVPKKPAAEVDSELAFHLEQRIEANIAKGMSPEAARRAALVSCESSVPTLLRERFAGR